jgi:hypothetical protein
MRLRRILGNAGLTKRDGMFKRVTIVLWVAFLPCAASAQNYGVGVRSCAQFAQDYRTNPILENIYFAWAEGFISGISSQALVEKLPFKQTQGGDARMQAYKQAIRTYCDEHPLVPYVNAVMSLYMTLPSAPRNSN